MEQHASREKTHSIASAQNTPLAGSVKRKLLLQLLHLKLRVIQILVSMAACAKKQESTRTLIVFALILGLKEGFVTWICVLNVNLMQDA